MILLGIIVFLGMLIFSTIVRQVLKIIKARDEFLEVFLRLDDDKVTDGLAHSNKLLDAMTKRMMSFKR